MLDLAEVEAGYGRAPVLRGVSLQVSRGEIVTLIGSNGAGKSTTLRTISGLLPVRKGHVRFLDRTVSALPPRALVHAGLVHIPEGRRLFADMTVRENLLLGGYTCRRRELHERLDRLHDWSPVLRERDHQLAGSLSGGEQQMLAIGRGLMANPTLLMLDEPSLGLAPKVVAQVAEMIRTIQARVITILLVEQNARLALQISDRAYVLQTGRIIREGSSAALFDDPFVRTAYLGL